MTKTEKLLRELIALPSVNPAFLPARHPHAGEQRVAEFLAATAAQAGLDVEFQAGCQGPLESARAPLASRQGAATGPARAAHGHGERRRGTIHAAPAATAASLAAAPATPRVRWRPCSWRCAKWRKAGSGRRTRRLSSPGWWMRSTRQAGSRALAASGLGADLAIVGEPTRLQVVTAHKGTLWLTLETRGKSAHGSWPELGRNAVHAMARIVDLLQTAYAAQLRRRRHPLLGCATVSVGAICGGTQANIVPDRCTILLDRRTLPGETEAGVRREIIGAAAPQAAQGGLCEDMICLPACRWKRIRSSRWWPVSCRALASASRSGCVTSAMRRCSRRAAFPAWSSGRATLRRRIRRTNGFPSRRWNAASGCCGASSNPFLEPEPPLPPPSPMPAQHS